MKTIKKYENNQEIFKQKRNMKTHNQEIWKQSRNMKKKQEYQMKNNLAGGREGDDFKAFRIKWRIGQNFKAEPFWIPRLQGPNKKKTIFYFALHLQELITRNKF